MTPWLRFWFPHVDADRKDDAAPDDAALWSPQAIADTQHELWRQAAQATHDWWAYWRALWPSVPLQPLAGVVTPPREPREPAPVPSGNDAAHAPVERRRAPRAAKAATARTARTASTTPARPRKTARGK